MMLIFLRIIIFIISFSPFIAALWYFNFEPIIIGSVAFGVFAFYGIGIVLSMAGRLIKGQS